MERVGAKADSPEPQADVLVVVSPSAPTHHSAYDSNPQAQFKPSAFRYFLSAAGAGRGLILLADPSHQKAV